MTKEINDPGTGKNFGKNVGRLVNSDGSYNIVRHGTRSGFRDFFSYLIEISWVKFFSLLFVGYVSMNLIFTLLFLLAGSDQINGIQSDQNIFLQVYFFSVQTFTTVGYGAISPNGVGAQIIASFEAFVGFLSFSLATGLLYGRFSRPNAKLIYSENILFSKYKSGYSLKMRFANERSSVLMELEASVLMACDRKDENGNVNKTYFRLPLEVSTIQMMPLSWTIVHAIDEDSPLWKKSKEEILALNPEIVVTVKGFDEVYGQHIRSRHSYVSDDFKWNKNFQKIFFGQDDGTVAIDLKDLNLIEDDSIV